jgi:hypothetical protein
MARGASVLARRSKSESETRAPRSLVQGVELGVHGALSAWGASVLARRSKSESETRAPRSLVQGVELGAHGIQAVLPVLGKVLDGGENVRPRQVRLLKYFLQHPAGAPVVVPVAG